MAVVANVQKLVDGPHNLVVRLSASMLNADSEVNVKKIDVTTLSTDSGAGALAQPVKKLVLLRSAFSTSNLIVRLLWEATPNLIFEVIPPNASYTKKQYVYGGIQDNAVTPTGNVLLTTETTGATNPADGYYDITLWFRKKYS